MFSNKRRDDSVAVPQHNVMCLRPVEPDFVPTLAGVLEKQDLACRIAADEHDREPRRDAVRALQFGNLRRDPRPHRFRVGLAVDDRSRHFAFPNP